MEENMGTRYRLKWANGEIFYDKWEDAVEMARTRQISSGMPAYIHKIQFMKYLASDGTEIDP